MSIHDLFVFCGGFGNVTRLLFTDEQLILALSNPQAEPNHPLFIQSQNVGGECQWVFARTDDMTSSQAMAISQCLAERQKKDANTMSNPVTSVFRPAWHISPPQGLLNDPNGFIYHNGQYHLFYQWYPYGCEHKDKHWVQLTSDNLIDWQWQSVALTPSAWFDSHGVFSGHAVSDGDTLYAYYTGNTRVGVERARQTTQCVAVSKQGGALEKLGPVINELPEGVTEHIRDPKVIEYAGRWWMILGAQTTELKGRLAVYHSSDRLNWQFSGLFGEELGELGYMWECPDVFELNGQQFAMFCPQGIHSPNACHSVEHHNGIAKLTLQSEPFNLRLRDFETLDHGFDFYAPQTMQTPDGRRVLCAWMGLPDDVDHPSVDEGWLHQLTCLRELEYREGRIYQRPVRELDALLCEQRTLSLNESLCDLGTQSFVLRMTLKWGQTLNLFEGDGYRVQLKACSQTRCLVLDRTNTLNRSADTIRQLPLACQEIEISAFVDTSSLELFINQGEYVMTSRVFASPMSTCVSLLGGQEVAKVHTVEPSMPPFSG